MHWSDSILRDKRILITGASSGIGRSCAILCSQLGAQIIACGRDQARLSKTLSALYGEGHISLSFELTDEHQIEDKLTGLKGSTPISGFIHCAGTERTNPLNTICMNDFTEMFKINVASAVVISRIIAKPQMHDKHGMSIVLISSVSGVMGEKGKIEYSATKSALLGLTKSLALDLAVKGIRVNDICPAMVKSEMLERMFLSLPKESVDKIKNMHLLGIPEAEDVANLAAYLISDLSRHITGTSMKIDSGYMIS